MAERRIAEKTGRGVICFISKYLRLDGLSFTGMRERYLKAFDAFRIDCLNGYRYKTSETVPDGSPGPAYSPVRVTRWESRWVPQMVARHPQHG
jgi:hypothetical protein